MVERAKKPAAISATHDDTPQPQVSISDDSSRVIARLPTGESVEVHLHGATVISWKSNDGRENLWLSEKAVLDGSKPIRGGIPVVFPNFGPPPAKHATSALPSHGFARNARWEYLGKSTTESNTLFRKSGGTGGSASGDRDTDNHDCVKLDFGLYPPALGAEIRKAWPYDFGLQYSITLGRDGLQTAMNVRNEGKEESFEFQMLLHTYLRIKDITKTSITGLLGTTYIDKVLDARSATESSSALRITSETDRVYQKLAQTTTTVLEDGSGSGSGSDKPRFDVIRDKLDDTVVWNPWSTKAAAMSDFGPPDGWKNMICVEAGSVSGWQRLEPGETFEAGQVLKSYA